jgi:hypothetical protein
MKKGDDDSKLHRLFYGLESFLKNHIIRYDFFYCYARIKKIEAEGISC